MLATAEQFFIALPDTTKPRSLLRSRALPMEPKDEGWEQYPPYLRGLPSLPDFLVHLSTFSSLTNAEVSCLQNYVDKLARKIKGARTEWESERLDVVDSL